MAQTDTGVQASDVLRGGFDLGFTYTRSTGPIIGAFLTGLRDKQIKGIKRGNGKVMCPPMEYDPETSDELTELVDLKDTGTVKTWSWVHEPRPKYHLQKPFAWALIQIDGAETSLLHMVDAGTADKMKNGMKVKARWADQRRGFMTDIACFEPA
jgi:uncharacterized OB-fold protein